MRIICDI